MVALVNRASLALVSFVGSIAACSAVVPAARASADAPTTVTTYAPALPRGVAERSGACWTDSSVAARPDAFRCAMGDVIVDPCFSVPSHDGVVVCGANPATGAVGFPLRIDEPLPARTPPRRARPWLLLLADGRVCAPFAGARPRVGAKFAEWYCASSATPSRTTLVTDLERGATWIASVHDASGAHRVVVRRAWE